ncbi:DNA-binding protein [Romboutsia sp.]|uniref:DNA-binding protein n=1 Tax=Romboutsia sp. TaxID=1965302 RepID=UPI003F3E79B4
MKGNERIAKFLELQNKNIDIEDIAKEIGITVKTLRVFLNKNNYKLKDGKYIFNEEEYSKKDNQMSFNQIEKKQKKVVSSNEKLEKNKKNKTKVENKPKNKAKVENKPKNKAKVESKPKSVKVIKDKKINITQEDLDKLCEVYDWYLQVRDYKSMKPKSISSKKDIVIEDNKVKELKTASIRLDKKTWENFERLCSNSNFTKQEIITQALKDFMKQYKNLL